MYAQRDPNSFTLQAYATFAPSLAPPLSLTLSPPLSLVSDRVWKDRAPRYARFFGPNVRATLKKYDAANRLVELSLITTAEGEDDAPLELLANGEYVPVLTVEQEEVLMESPRCEEHG